MNLITPFGEIIILLDDKEYDYSFVKKEKNERLFPNVLGCYRIVVEFVPDGKEHEIKCLIPNMEYFDRGPESGEGIECQAFYQDDMKLSICVECETGYLPNGSRWSDRYDYDVSYLENGMSYLILNKTKEDKYIFGLSWIDNVVDNHGRDVQTWFAADFTID